MRILLGQWHAAGYAGSQLWNYEIARALRDMGHDVAFYTGGRGMMAARCMSEGFHVYSYLMDDRPKADLAIISQPRTFQVCRFCGGNPVVETDDDLIPKHLHRWRGEPCKGSETKSKSVLPDCRRIYVMHGWLPHDAPLLDGSPYVTISKETHDRLLKGKGVESVVVNQPIDLARFLPKCPLRSKPKAAALSTFPADPGVVEKCCEDAGVELLPRLGLTWDVPKVINEADIVIGTGRGCMEAMACGRVAVVCGRSGCDGIVDADSWDELFGVNLSGRATMAPPHEALVPALQSYDPAIGAWGRGIAESLFDPRQAAERLLEAA